MTYPDINGSVRSDLASVVSGNTTLGTVSDFDQSSFTTIGTTATSQVRGGGKKNTTKPSCRTGYLRNINVFVICLCLAFLVRGAMLQYTEDIMLHIGRRYPITNMELEFAIGCERIGFVVTLLFVAFFGNRIHKPIAISIGLFLCALGSILMAVPFFISGPRLYEGKISQFATAGLCKQTNRNISFQTQCDLIFYKEDDASRAFSLICFAKFLVGIGGALYASLGIVYIDEGSKQPAVPVYIGSVLSMHGIGRFIGNLLAVWFTVLPEALDAEESLFLQQTFAVYDQERVGRWWLAYPIFFSLFLCVSLMTLWFPKYIIIPDWITRRKTRRAKLQAEYDRRLKMKMRAAAAKKRHSSEVGKKKKTKRKNKSDEKNGSANGSTPGIEEDGNRDDTLGVINEIDPIEDETLGEEYPQERGDAPSDTEEERGVDEDGYENGDNSLYPALDNEGYEPVSTDNDAHADNTSLEVNMEDSRGEERITDFEDQEKRLRSRGSTENLAVPDRKNNTSVLSDKSAPPSSRRGGRGSSPRKHYQKSASTAGSATPFRRKIIRIRKEELKDLPHSLWKLLNNMKVLIMMLGSILAGFFFNGYLATLPEYIHVQFEQTWSTSIILAGVIGPLAWGLGTLIGGILVYKFRALPLSKVTLAVVGCIIFSCLLTTINMAFHCSRDTSPDEALVAQCGTACECDSYKVQYEPLCGPDGKTYPSPCHAGCKAVQLTSTPGLFNFTGCTCVSGGHALQGACVPDCTQLRGFAVITFLSVLVASVGIVPVFIVIFRGVRSRSRSLAVGFAIWGVYTISTTLGPVAFRYVRRGRCLLWGEDCLEAEVCWRYELGPYRYIVNGLAAAFLLASAIPFLLVYWRLKKTPAKTSKPNSRPVSTENPDISDATEQATQTADLELYVINELPTEESNGTQENNNTSQHI